MEEVKNINSALSEVEIAYHLLKSGGQPRNLRELMQEIFAIKGLPMDDPRLMAAVHTQINLDNRFAHLGQGNWGLREWTQTKVVRRVTPSGFGTRAIPVRRRSLQDEIEYEDGEYSEKYDIMPMDDEEDEWEE
ncbi:DNA-directed RNA polymerase subunit delta [Thermanaerosceptrum fracticalcis]|uniref:RNAP delta factor n=1 Tax=Thermanaerosceptrum fracticalcis TaxID=1712410 RepID=A0A7G6E4S7_THEFR|nr:DNA-directed RNA polymerase subunit delta [Thermanaerosceptrum fracticalcis]QNB47081.1 DNA-directed RNA polymerase subunit delta [Thermanaerosceptrum fracticalcis]